MKKQNHIVLTTINFPSLLSEYSDNIKNNKLLETTKVWVIGDIKTPREVNSFCKRLSKEGLEVDYVDISRQDKWGKKYHQFYKQLPYNNETRRNIGYLLALEDGCERIISIDDDNWPTNDNFIGFHSITGGFINDSLVSTKNGYYNVCEHIAFNPQRPIFPRGYPFTQRGIKNQIIQNPKANKIRIGVNMGLWINDPDVDATTWLNGKIIGEKYTGKRTTVLDKGTWLPINTQNTSVAYELIPAFLCIPMGWSVPGGKIQRYGDIWGGYFLQALIKNTDYHVAFGRPIVDHRRNPHDYIDDLRFEYWGMIMTDWLLQYLKFDFSPKQTVIVLRLIELSNYIERKLIPKLPKWCTSEFADFMKFTASNLKLWSYTCQEIFNNK